MVELDRNQSRQPRADDFDRTETDRDAKREASRKKERLDEKLDQALEDSFPGSDPVSLVQPPPSARDKHRP
jgi:hypothetical protein